MKKLILSTLVAACVAVSLTLMAADPAPKSVLRHVVTFKFKESASEAQIKEVVDAFRALKTKIPEIRAFEWGTNNSPENLNQGLTHCFLVTFSSEKDRDDYLVHPEHKKFVEILKPHLDKVTVLDYWTQK